jgi:eukaryotic-like serine/threonine-protein kinase
MRPGTLIDNFTIERLAGAGGMGEVYLARDRRTGAPAALKLLHAQRPEHEKRFAREARVLAELNHPGVVRYLAHGITPDGRPYLAMEWVDGESLSDRLARGPLTRTESLLVGLQVAEALQVAHRMGIVHRDLKPSNLILCSEGSGRTGAPAKTPPKTKPNEAITIKILDFGIARLLDPERTQLTATGLMLGTPGYMAPEQARGDRNVDARADLFALGSILYRCLTGAPAFEGENALAVLMKSTFEDAPRASAKSSAIPPDLDDLIARLLARAPEGRPASAEAVATELQAILHAIVHAIRHQTSASPPKPSVLATLPMDSPAPVAAPRGAKSKRAAPLPPTLLTPLATVAMAPAPHPKRARRSRPLLVVSAVVLGLGVLGILLASVLAR